MKTERLENAKKAEPKVEAQTRIEPATNALVEQICAKQDWKRAHTLRRAIEIGIRELAKGRKTAKAARSFTHV